MDIDVSLLYSARGFDGEMRKLLESMMSRVKDLKGQTFTGTSDDDRIEAVVGAAGDLKSVSIHILSKRRNDNQTLSDLVLEAIQKAQTAAKSAQQDILANLNIFGIPASQVMERHAELIESLNPREWGL